eukprot:TRINITY_DN25708_c0_g2_i2.p1 TRINITY_DN25708_c0_g2~~TRINITY_DN25708_c0_g2_i2.p1  ORF type:complete len:625 (-),score=82.15 TRINITY_DN25708_c0_g2_i2:53-1903(-)
MASTAPEAAPGAVPEAPSAAPPSDPPTAGPQTSDGEAAAKAGCGPRRPRLRPRTPEGEYIISFAVVCLIVAIDIGSGTILAPIIPFYVKMYGEAAELGPGKANAIITASYALAQFIATPIFGMLSDKFGRRPVLLASPFFSTIWFLAQGFAGGFWQFCAFRFLAGLFSGSRPVAMAYVGDAVAPAKMPKYMSMVATSVSASMFISPILGGSLGLVSVRLPCFFVSLCCFLTFLIAWFHVKEPDRSSRGGTNSAALPPPSSNWKMWVFINAVVGYCIMGVIMSWITIFPIVATDTFSMDSNRVGLVLGTSGLLVAIVQFAIFVPLSRRTTMPIIGAMGSVCASAPAWVPLIQKDALAGWVVTSYLLNVGAALIMPGISVISNQLAPSSARGAVLSFTVSLQAVSRVVSAMVSGALLDAADWYPHVFIGCMAFFAISCQLCLATKVERTNKPKSPASDKTEPHSSDIKPVNLDPRREDSDVASAEGAELYQARVNAQTLHENLLAAMEELRQRRTDIASLEDPSQVETAAAPPVTLEERHNIGEWLSDMLMAHNYIHWTKYVDNIKVVLRNAFPPLRRAPLMHRLEDLIYVLESHLQLGKQWEKEEFHLDMTSAVIFA